MTTPKIQQAAKETCEELFSAYVGMNDAINGLLIVANSLRNGIDPELGNKLCGVIDEIGEIRNTTDELRRDIAAAHELLA